MSDKQYDSYDTPYSDDSDMTPLPTTRNSNEHPVNTWRQGKSFTICCIVSLILNFWACIGYVIAYNLILGFWGLLLVYIEPAQYKQNLWSIFYFFLIMSVISDITSLSIWGDAASSSGETMFGFILSVANLFLKIPWGFYTLQMLHIKGESPYFVIYLLFGNFLHTNVTLDQYDSMNNSSYDPPLPNKNVDADI